MAVRPDPFGGRAYPAGRTSSRTYMGLVPFINAKTADGCRVTVWRVVPIPTL